MSFFHPDRAMDIATLREVENNERLNFDRLMATPIQIGKPLIAAINPDLKRARGLSERMLFSLDEATAMERNIDDWLNNQLRPTIEVWKQSVLKSRNLLAKLDGIGKRLHEEHEEAANKRTALEMVNPTTPEAPPNA
jgi:hypothetical protein